MAGMIENGTMTAGMGRLLEIAAGLGSMFWSLAVPVPARRRCWTPWANSLITVNALSPSRMRQSCSFNSRTWSAWRPGLPASKARAGDTTRSGVECPAHASWPDHRRRVRGAEAFDMLQAMNTGHDGSISTVHANTTRDALTRIENMVQMGQPNLPCGRFDLRSSLRWISSCK
jgi:Flp pilus assembly protein, ATPase CpaF